MTPTEHYHALTLLPPRLEPTERHKAKAISIAAVRRAARNQKRGWRVALEPLMRRGGAIYEETHRTPQTFQKGSK